MDATDFAVIRYMYPGGMLRSWGSRPIVDPRITPRDIASRVGLSEVAVRSRIAQLTRRGVIQGDEVWPNPSTLGIRFENAEFPVGRGPRVSEALEAFRRVEGMITARIILDRGRRRLWVTYVRDRPSRTARRVSEIGRICGSEPARPPSLSWVPVCRRKLTPTEWRVVAALRASPSRSLGTQAIAARLSPKTFARYFHALLDEVAILWARNIDFTKWPGAVFYIFLRTPADRDRVFATIENTVRTWIPVGAGGLGDSLRASSPWIAGDFYVPTPIACEELEDLLLQIPGVQRVVRRLVGRVVDYPEWFDARLAEQLREPTRRPAAFAAGLPPTIRGALPAAIA